MKSVRILAIGVIFLSAFTFASCGSKPAKVEETKDCCSKKDSTDAGCEKKDSTGCAEEGAAADTTKITE
ncbi:MAG: hypothetical protein AB9846_11570 [Tenuifilaceae bacterium]